jgi:hypothetical protein
MTYNHHGSGKLGIEPLKTNKSTTLQAKQGYMGREQS